MTQTPSIPLDRLIDSRLELKLRTVAESVRAEGWSWVKVEPYLDDSLLSAYRRVEPDHVPLTGEQSAEIDALIGEYDEIASTPEAAQLDEDVLSYLELIQSRIAAADAMEQHWSKAVLATAGAIVGLDWSNTVIVERGLLRHDFSEAE